MNQSDTPARIIGLRRGRQNRTKRPASVPVMTLANEYIEVMRVAERTDSWKATTSTV